jgi:hypothetical protein
MKNLILFTCALLLFAQNLNAINVSGTISIDETWTLANSPYLVTGDISISDEVTLTIEPGVVVEFNSSLRDIFVFGNIQAIGNSTDSIFFRGVGGVRGNIAMLNSGTLEVSAFEYCVFEEMGGSGSSGSAIRLDIPTIVQNCRFNNNNDIFADADAIGLFDNTNRLTDIRISGNSLDSSITFRNADAEGFYYQMQGDLIVSDLDTMTIEPGVEILFPSSLYEIYVDGTIIANGTSTDSISFIGTSQGRGAIRLANIGNVDTSEFTYCNFTNLGSTSIGTALEVFQPVLLSNSVFSTNTSDMEADADFLEGLDESNRIEEIKVFGNSLASSTTWPVADETGFKYSMLGDQLVSEGTTLSIEPGVVVEFRSSLYEFYVDGSLIANGTETDSIFFIGKLNNRGGIRLAGVGEVDTSEFNYCVFDSLGSTATGGRAIEVYHPMVMNNCRFNTNQNIIADADFLSQIGSSNRLDEIAILNRSLDSTTVWPNADDSGFNYILLGDQIVGEGKTLELEPSINICFPSSLHEIYVDGKILANGTPTDSITFKGLFQGAGAIRLANIGEVDTSSFTYCNFDSLGATAIGSAFNPVQPFTMSNCAFKNNVLDIRADADFLWGMNETNRFAEIQLLNRSLDSTTIWPDADATGFDYVTLGDQIVPEGETLTIEAGVEVYFKQSLHELYVDGKIVAEGTMTDSIQFIGDPVGSGGIFINSIGDMDTSTLKFCSFKNLGSIALGTALRISNPVLVANTSFSNSRDVIADADFVWGFDSSNRLKEIELIANSLSTTTNWPIADETGFIYRMLGDLRLPAGEILTIEEGVEVLQNSTIIELFIEGEMIMMDNVPGKEVRFYRE